MALIEINRNPSPRELRWFGAVLALALAALGAVLRWHFGVEAAAPWLWVTAAVLGVVYYAVPPARRPIYLGFTYAVFPIGWVISHLVLAATYYLVLAPIGLVLRAFGHHFLELGFRRDKASYWIERAPVKDARRYFKQF
jgi:hypothetical protein